MRNEADDGFTLVESLVALIIIGLVAAITLPAIGDVTRRHAEARSGRAIGDQALSVLAIAESGAVIAGNDPAFVDWRVTRRDLLLEETGFARETYWLEARHMPSGAEFRVLITQ